MAVIRERPRPDGSSLAVAIAGLEVLWPTPATDVVVLWRDRDGAIRLSCPGWVPRSTVESIPSIGMVLPPTVDCLRVQSQLFQIAEVKPPGGEPRHDRIREARLAQGAANGLCLEG